MTQSYETRIEMIRKAAAKFNNKMKTNIRIKDYTKVEVEDIDESVNINAWTDSEKYVDEYYGDRAREQSSYESEWN